MATTLDLCRLQTLTSDPVATRWTPPTGTHQVHILYYLYECDDTHQSVQKDLYMSDEELNDLESQSAKLQIDNLIKKHQDKLIMYQIHSERL